MQPFREGMNSTGRIDLAKCVDEYGDHLFRFALWRVKDRDLAEELVQETFLAAHRASNTFEERASLKTWLVAILRNKIIDHYRKVQRRPETSLDEMQEKAEKGLFSSFGLWKVWLEDWRSSPEELLEQKGFLSQLQDCIDHLPVRFRELLVLRVFDDLSSKEICEKLQITDKNLWVMLYRARMQLRSCLDGNWFQAAHRNR